MKQTSSNLKKSILAFVKNLVSKKVYAAIEILLTPCCKPVVLSAEAECTGTEGFVKLTVKVDKNITTFGNDTASFYVFISSLNLLIGSSSYSSNGTYIFEFQGIDDYSGNLYFEMFVPTSSDGSIGASVTSDPFQITFPTCP